MPDSVYQNRLKAMTAAATEPLLSDPEIDALLTQFATADADGNEPADLTWVATYNLRAAAREGWKWKAGKCSDLVSSDLDGDRMSSNQLFEHCERMARKYAAAASPSIGYDPDDVDNSFFA